MLLSLIIGVLLGAVSVAFIAENTSIVTVTFLSWQFDGSLALVLMMTLITGVVITLLFLLPTFIRDMFYLSAVEKQKRVVEDELLQTKQKLAEVATGPHGSGAIVVETAP